MPNPFDDLKPLVNLLTTVRNRKAEAIRWSNTKDLDTDAQARWTAKADAYDDVEELIKDCIREYL
jgi:hypothetical protein